jgi:hypothetical protein
MNKLKVHQVLDLITDIVSEPSGTWKEQRDLILAECTESQKTNLFEFVAWFDDVVMT